MAARLNCREYHLWHSFDRVSKPKRQTKFGMYLHQILQRILTFESKLGVAKWAADSELGLISAWQAHQQATGITFFFPEPLNIEGCLPGQAQADDAGPSVMALVADNGPGGAQ